MVDEVGNEALRLPSDEEVIGQVADGRVEALRILSRRFGGVITAVAIRILGDNADAEEVAADVIWQVWRQGAGFDRERGSVAAWLITSARSRALDRLRALNTRRPAPSQAIEAAALPASGPAAPSGRSQYRRALETALDEGERRLLELVYYSDLSQSEIADRIGIPPANVKTQICGAMMKLKGSLEGARL
jgi:RNA polymerase sigma-70 factor (ECF subfamily)